MKIRKKTVRLENVPTLYGTPAPDFLNKLFAENVIKMVNGEHELNDGEDVWFSDRSEERLMIDYREKTVKLYSFGTIKKQYTGDNS